MSGIPLRDGARALDEQAVAELHDVRFVDGRNLLPAEPARIVEGELGDPRGRFGGDDLQAFDDAGDDHVLQAGVQVLGVLANDHQIHVLKPAGDARQIRHRSQVRKEIEPLPNLDVDAGEPAANRRRDRALERDAIPAYRLHDFIGQRLARPFSGDQSRHRDVPRQWAHQSPRARRRPRLSLRARCRRRG